MMNITKRQHFIPQFYLRKFIYNRDKVWVLSRKDNRISSHSIRDICVKNYLYETKWKTPVWGKDFVLLNSIENDFAQKEGEYAKLLDDIIKRCENSNKQKEFIFGDNEKEKMASFVANLFCRNPKAMEICMQEMPGEDEIDELREFKKVCEAFKIDDFSSLYTHALKCSIFNENILGTPVAKIKQALMNSNIDIWKSSSEASFVVGSFPILVEDMNLEEGEDLWIKNLFLPISPKLGIIYYKKGDDLLNWKDRILEISANDVRKMNSYFYHQEKEEFLISQSEDELQRLKNMMR